MTFKVVFFQRISFNSFFDKGPFQALFLASVFLPHSKDWYWRILGLRMVVGRGGGSTTKGLRAWDCYDHDRSTNESLIGFRPYRQFCVRDPCFGRQSSVGEGPDREE